MAYGEVGSLLRYFHNQSCENPSFQYAIQLDSEEQITNIFWADARMISAYAHFGDVVTFDTTYSTNKEYRPFGVFTGFNHHRETIIFGAALLYDETVDSFKWLFDTFLKAHKQKKPKTIFTDQDHAMAKALAEALPDTFHGLCSWHIMQNGIKHLGYLMKEGSYFLTEFAACMYEYEEEKEFEDAWSAMRCKYEVCENPWLDKIYEIKKKWARCYMKKFERVTNEKHYKELQAEYNSRQKLPMIKVQKSPLLQHAAKEYTPTVFEKYFQEEFDWSLAAIVKEHDESSDTYEYTIAIVDEKKEHKEHKVKFQPSDHSTSCSCMKFQTFVILCRHALKVLDVWDIKRVPDQYILKRWTREARNEDVESNYEENVVKDKKLTIAERYRTVCPILVNIASRASGDEKAYELVMKVAHKLKKEVEDIFLDNSTMSHDEPHDHAQVHQGEKMVQDNPIESLLQKAKGLKKKTGCKGRKKCPKAWHEDIGKGKKRSSSKDKDKVQEVEPSNKKNKRSSDNDRSKQQQSMDQTQLIPSRNIIRISTKKDESLPQQPQNQEVETFRKRSKKRSTENQSHPQESQDQGATPLGKRKRQLSIRLAGYKT